MSIVFDRVSAEIAPPPQAGAPQAQDTPGTAGTPSDAACEVLREKLALWAEREQRQRAD